MMTPVVSEARIPAKVPVPSIVIDLVIVTAPKPPGSRASISPQSAVLEIAPAKVLQGADCGEIRSEEHTSELQSLRHLVCRLLLEKKNKKHHCLDEYIHHAPVYR